MKTDVTNISAEQQRHQQVHVMTHNDQQRETEINNCFKCVRPVYVTEC